MPVTVNYKQSRHAHQDTEASTFTYDSYKTAVEAVVEYFRERLGRYPNEELRGCPKRSWLYWEGTHINKADLTKTLMTHESSVTRGDVFCIHLTLDGTTNFGRPILQAVELSVPHLVIATRDTARAERLSKYGEYCYCGDPDCDYDCGTLSCGCIDMCRGRCGDCPWEDRYY